jgi:hypothetical protein
VKTQKTTTSPLYTTKPYYIYEHFKLQTVIPVDEQEKFEKLIKSCRSKYIRTSQEIVDKVARLQISQELGHNRMEITNCYLGSNSLKL